VLADLAQQENDMSLARKIARKKQKAVFQEFKKKMKQFKKMVACSVCQRPPDSEEKIDNWKINQKSENLDLLCPDCFGHEEEWRNGN
jgi:Zn finger protein HypA/HybF involved in hydrogenase expression